MHYRTPITYGGEDEPDICHYCEVELKEGEVFYLYPEVMWERTPAWMRSGSRPSPRKCCKKCYDRYMTWMRRPMEDYDDKWDSVRET